MHDRDASNYIYAFVVLAFAGLAGLANSISVLRAGDQPNLSLLVAAMLCLPVAIGLGRRSATIILHMYRSNRSVERRIAMLWLSAIVCGFLGAVALARVESDADAVGDSRNDWIVYTGFSLSGMAFLLAFVGSTIFGVSRDREA